MQSRMVEPSGFAAWRMAATMAWPVSIASLSSSQPVETLSRLPVSGLKYRTYHLGGSGSLVVRDFLLPAFGVETYEVPSYKKFEVSASDANGPAMRRREQTSLAPTSDCRNRHLEFVGNLGLSEEPTHDDALRRSSIACSTGMSPGSARSMSSPAAAAHRPRSR